MGHIKELNSPDPQAFPGATFEIVGDVPASQCSEARIEGIGALTRGLPFNSLHALGAPFFGEALVGKICTITASTGGNLGPFQINTHDHANLTFGASDPGNGTNVEWHIHNGGDLILTRNIQSFAEFISAAGWSHTIKGGKLYTNISRPHLQPACTILFDPLT